MEKYTKKIIGHCICNSDVSIFKFEKSNHSAFKHGNRYAFASTDEGGYANIFRCPLCLGEINETFVGLTQVNWEDATKEELEEESSSAAILHFQLYEKTREVEKYRQALKDCRQAMIDYGINEKSIQIICIDNVLK